VEKPSMLNIIAKKTEQCISEGSISMVNLLGQKSLDKIEEAGKSLEELCNIRISQRRFSSIHNHIASN